MEFTLVALVVTMVAVVAIGIVLAIDERQQDAEGDTSPPPQEPTDDRVTHPRDVAPEVARYVGQDPDTVTPPPPEQVSSDPTLLPPPPPPPNW